MRSATTDDDWGVCPWNPTCLVDLIHPDDLELAKKHYPHFHFVHKMGSDGEWLVVEYCSFRLRVRPQLFHPMPSPAFSYGDRVRTLSPRTVRRGVIRDIGWHGTRRTHLYYIYENHKRVRNRYFDYELERDNG